MSFSPTHHRFCGEKSTYTVAKHTHSGIASGN